MSDSYETIEDQSGLLPTEFWAAPEKFIQDAGMRLLHAEVIARLQSENPEAGVLEQLAMERVTSLYFYMRDREMRGGLDTAAAYKGIMSLWVNMAADLRKARTDGETADAIRVEITKTVVTAVKDAIQGLDPDIAITIQRRVLQSLTS